LCLTDYFCWYTIVQDARSIKYTRKILLGYCISNLSFLPSYFIVFVFFCYCSYLVIVHCSCYCSLFLLLCSLFLLLFIVLVLCFIVFVLLPNFLFSVLCVLFVCKFVMYCCHRVSTQLRLNIYISYFIICVMSWGMRSANLNKWQTKGHSMSSEPNFQHSDPRIKLSKCEAKIMNSFGDDFKTLKM
jgi:hypothetical protein